MFFQVKIPLRASLIFVEMHHFDVVWVFANNPSTAVLRAERWYDTYKPNRRRTDAESLVKETQPTKGNLEKIKNQPIIYQYTIWYRIRQGKSRKQRIAALSFGENDSQAKKFAKAFFPLVVEEEDIVAIQSVERIPIKKE